MIYDATDLYDKLTSEQTEGQYFRGQNRAYAGPLWPSSYRMLARSEKVFTDKLYAEPEDLRVRRCGTHFYYGASYLERGQAEPELEYLERCRRERLKQYVMTLTRNALGYPLAEACFQQAGMRSEGLDVTDNVQIAFFFALFEWSSEGYRLRPDTGESCVIYRWKLDRSPWTWDFINRYDFYSGPRLIPSEEIFRLFGPCDTIAQCRVAFRAYQNAIDWHPAFFDLDRLRGNRPFYLMRIPAEHLASCRIVKQHAALLLPDLVLSAAHAAAHASGRFDRSTIPRVREDIAKGVFVADMAQDPCCETFYFSAAEAKRMSWLAEVEPSTVFPTNDIIFTIIRGWARDILKPQALTPIIPMEVLCDRLLGPVFSDSMQKLLRDFETEFFL